MKKQVLIILFMLFFNSGAWAATPETPASELPMDMLDGTSIANINKFISNINNELNTGLPLLNTDIIKEIAAQGLSLDWKLVWYKALNYLFKELAVNMNLMGKLLFLAVLCALLQNLHSSFEHSTMSMLAYCVCFIFLAVIALNAFHQGMTLAKDTVGNMVGFMEALLPLLLSLLAGVGAVTSVALFTPLMLLVVSVMSLVVKDVILPLLFLSSVLECVNYLAGKYRMSNLSGVIKQSALVLLGLSMVIFIGIITIQGAAGSVADGLTLRTAKYATATFIPVVGKMFADTVELVMGASLLLKNAVGVFGVMVIMTLCALPLIKLLSLIIMIKIAGALIQPMGDENMAKCLDGIGNNFLLVFGALLTVALMFFLVITMVIGTGTMTMMLR
ncbi:MAG TPA: stage III sporulation protein AE [Methylomusa anaerophila]|uniref:Stage III sporulation protein AE n=1 Tax=Methylomusa anaerophila TaxID=1930071 RepID=A0A348APB2_9FIRM|nr:stage III sporulation protein AE [Methylomusa anaerophila]BBB92910.1 stage III sporulation protein AE precursor [Methylomusa anaerophila]HML87254.1 stage III sporulation protein AE [Methylomusa anaerophila]